MHSIDAEGGLDEDLAVGVIAAGLTAQARLGAAYGRDADEVEHVEHGNMPSWAADNARGYWQAADAGERANGRLFVEVQFALPNELDRSQQRDLARAFARQLTEGKSLPYTVAVHRGESKEPSKPDNPHAHIVLSERSNDGRARMAETWFRRANRQHPERGGARKVSHLQAREWPERIRQGWSNECNRALERAGRGERIDPRTLAEQARAALKNGDLDQAAELARTPEPKRGAGGQDEELEGERGCRVGTRFADSGECRGDLCVRQRPLVFAAGGVLRQRGGHGTYP